MEHAFHQRVGPLKTTVVHSLTFKFDDRVTLKVRVSTAAFCWCINSLHRFCTTKALQMIYATRLLVQKELLDRPLLLAHK